MKTDNGYQVKISIEKIEKDCVEISVVSKPDGVLYSGPLNEWEVINLVFPGYFMSENRLDNLLDLEESIKFIAEEK